MANEEAGRHAPSSVHPSSAARDGAVAALYLLVGLFAASYVFTHTARAFVPAVELGKRHQNVSFTTSDGLELSGWYIPSENRAAVIAFPGRSGPQRPARMLAGHGYGVLLFDRRGEGESDGDPNVFGLSGEKTSARRWSSFAAGPTSTRTGSGGSGSRWEAR